MPLALNPLNLRYATIYNCYLLLVTGFTSFTQSYKKLHQKAIVVDTHNDVLDAAIMKGMHIEDDLTGKTRSDLNRFKTGGVDVQVFAVFCDSTFGKDTAFKFANIEIDSLYAIAARNDNKMVIVRSPKELLLAIKHKKLAAMIGVEGGHMIEESVNYLDSLYKRGARYLTLTWFNSTSWATSSLDESTNQIKNNKRGLNDFGRSVIKRMNELGMMIDVSHVGEATFWDVINCTSKPIIASHSSVYSLTAHHRNLKDEQIKAIAKNGGVIQVNFSQELLGYSSFFARRRAFSRAHQSEIDSLIKINKNRSEIGRYLQKTYPQQMYAIRPSVSVLLDHIDYIVKLVGVDYVGLGSDFDGISSPVKGLEDVSQFPNVTKGLAERGYGKQDIKKIWAEIL